MADSVRDLTDPRDFGGSDGVAAVAAVERYQQDKVKVIPLRMHWWATEPWHSPQPRRAA